MTDRSPQTIKFYQTGTHTVGNRLLDETSRTVQASMDRSNAITSGHRACQGCGEALGARYALDAALRTTDGQLVAVNATGCLEVFTTPYPETSWQLPWLHSLFGNAPAVATGVAAAFRVKGRKNVKVVAQGGDGGTTDIGFGCLSGMFERNDDFIYICYDNEAYMNTGIQRSSATPFGASTTTSPAGKMSIGQTTWKKNVPAIAAAHDIPYVATACPSYPFDLMKKVDKAAKAAGPAYLHILAVCPTGWRVPANTTINLGRLAVTTGIFPLYEIVAGKYKLNVDPPKLLPVDDYLKLQGRFRHMSPQTMAAIQDRVTAEYARLKKRASEDC